MMAKHLPQKPYTQLLIYQTESGDTKIEVRLEDETVWLTQKLMAELFQTKRMFLISRKIAVDNKFDLRYLKAHVSVRSIFSFLALNSEAL